MAGRQIPTHALSLVGTLLLLAVVPGRAQEVGGSPVQTPGEYECAKAGDPQAAMIAQARPRGVLLQGRVRDPLSAPIAGATITAAPDAGSPGISTASDGQGDFSLLLSSGVYTVRVLAPGFAETGRTVDVRQTAAGPIEFVLQIAGSHETVMVESGGYQAAATPSSTRTLTPLQDIPQSITVITQDLMRDQLMTSIGDVIRYVPGITVHQGENNRDQLVIRGNSSSADFFLNGVRDDVQYFRDLYNLERVEALKGPNAMAFGRGGGGGAINRVTKEAGFTPLREMALQTGSYGDRRLTTDFDWPFGTKLAVRLNGMYEASGSFRNHVDMTRYGVSPTLTIVPGTRTRITFAYENFRDRRVADRGIPSFQGKPAPVDIAAFFGNPWDSRVLARVNLGAANLEHQIGAWTIRSGTLVGDYDRGYQNYVPGPITRDGTQATVSAYNNATHRRNVFNQTDLTYAVSTGRIQHLLLAGFEVGRQPTDNFRNTGYFLDTATTTLVPVDSPTITTPVVYRQSVTDPDNHVEARQAAAFVQDQVRISRQLQAVAGIRFEYFDLDYHNNRTGDDLRRIDHLASPRAGIVYKPFSPLSVYGSYAVSYLPSSGDQFSSLTSITQQVKPEKFTNYELGLKWDLHRRLSVATAAYRLDRTNTRAIDPADPGRIVQTGSQRTNGYELGWNGKILPAWEVAGGFAWQDARIVTDTVAARAGARVAQVPRYTVSLWNNYRFTPRVGGGLGIHHRSEMYAAVDNSVTLPGYARLDAAAFFLLTERVRLQFNVENVLNAKYFLNANGNNNISPGSPLAVRLALTARF